MFYYLVLFGTHRRMPTMYVLLEICILSIQFKKIQSQMECRHNEAILNSVGEFYYRELLFSK